MDKIRLYAPNGRKFYDVKQGFSWTLFFFWATFGIVFFIRNMVPYALGSIAFFLVNMFLNVAGGQEAMAYIILQNIVSIGMSFYFGFKGNQLTMNYLLDQGWTRETKAQYDKRMGWAPKGDSALV